MIIIAWLLWKAISLDNLWKKVLPTFWQSKRFEYHDYIFFTFAALLIFLIITVAGRTTEQNAMFFGSWGSILFIIFAIIEKTTNFFSFVFGNLEPKRTTQKDTNSGLDTDKINTFNIIQKTMKDKQIRYFSNLKTYIASFMDLWTFKKTYIEKTNATDLVDYIERYNKRIELGFLKSDNPTKSINNAFEKIRQDFIASDLYKSIIQLYFIGNSDDDDADPSNINGKLSDLKDIRKKQKEGSDNSDTNNKNIIKNQYIALLKFFNENTVAFSEDEKLLNVLNQYNDNTNDHEIYKLEM